MKIAVLEHFTAQPEDGQPSGPVAEGRAMRDAIVASGAEVLRVVTERHRRDGVTVVLVTHEPALARAAGRLIHMRDGEIQSRFQNLP